jgi:hypothetical protein
MSQSESESPAQSAPLDILVDMLAVDWLLDCFPDAERGVSGGIEILGHGVKRTLGLLPLLDLMKLHGG